MNKNNEKKHGVIITAKLKDRKTIVENLDAKKRIDLPFRGIKFNGKYEELLTPKSKKRLLVRIYNELLKEGVAIENKEKLWKNVCKNIDPYIVNVLKQSDLIENNGEKKYITYAKIMTKDNEKHRYEKNRAYKKRVDLVRKVELEDSGIYINYDLSGMSLFGKGFFDKVKAINKAFKFRRISKPKLFNKKVDETQTEIIYVGKEEYQKNTSKHKYVAKMNTIDKLKEETKNAMYKKKIKQRLLKLGTVTLMSIGVATFLSPSKTTNAIPVQQDNGYKSSSSNEISNNTSEHKNFIEEESESKDANQEEQQQFNMKEILKQSVDLKLGKDTKFNLSEGTFWESPDGTGKSGKVNPNDELFVTDIDVVDENGFKHYNVSDNLTINEIRQKHQNGTFSYHVNCMDKDREKIYGWVTDEKTISKIDNQMTNSRLKTLLNYLTPEAKEIFYNIVSQDSEKITESNKEIIETLIREAKLAEKDSQKNEISSEER